MATNQGATNTRSLAGGSAVAGNDFNQWAMRFRCNAGSDTGFIWENGSEQLLMSLNGLNGTLWTKGLLTASAGVSTTTLTASGLLTANAGITYTGTLTSATNTSGAKIGIQGPTDGTSAKGIFLWDTTNTSWGIYAASGGALNTRSLANGLAVSGNDFASYSFRFRVANDATMGFIWENSSEQLLMSLNGSTGTLWTKGNISINGALAATQSYVDTKDGGNVKLTGDQTITGIKIFNGTRNDIRALNLLSQADFNNVDIINGGNITYNGARILNQNGGDIFFSQTTGDWYSFLYTLNTASSGTADQRGYVFTNIAYDVAKGAGLYISKLTDAKFLSSDIVRFNNAGGMKFYGALDMNSNNITSGGTITGTTITGTTISASTKITTATGKPIIIGNTTKGTGPSAGLELYGAYGDFTAGPHIQAITTEDTYPLFTIANLGHNNIILAFDAYLDNAGWKSSYANANFRIAKVSNTLSFGYKSGIAVGSAITWSEAMNIDNAGLITTSGNVVVGAGKSVFIDRSGYTNTNNKLVLWDNGTGSTTAFIGFGVASQTLIYNVNTISDSHVFYYGATNELFRINNTAITASKSITANEKITTASGKPIIIGNTTKGTGSTGGLELYGSVNNIAGPHIQAITTQDAYPAFQLLNYSHDNISLNFDCYWDGSNWKSGSSGSNFQIYKISNKLSFYYNSGTTAGSNITWTEAMNINTSGEVVIPTASSGNLIIRKRPAATYDPQIFMKSGGYTNYGVVCGSTGLVHAWTTTNSTTGEPSGSYNYIPLNGAWTNSSDRRLKSDIKTLDCGDCCEKLMKINCCSYYWKTDEKKEKKGHGFIADEVKKIFPEFVSESGIKAEDGDGNLEGITYTDFIPILVSAFQHLSEKVVNLEKENKTLLNMLQDQANLAAEPSNAP